jgi:hypothetical protein
MPTIFYTLLSVESNGSVNSSRDESHSGAAGIIKILSNSAAGLLFLSDLRMSYRMSSGFTCLFSKIKQVLLQNTGCVIADQFQIGDSMRSERDIKSEVSG